MSNKDLSYYMNLPYKIEVTPEEGGTGFDAEIPDLKGCTAFGDTLEEAYETITEVKKTWVEIALERGWRIPEPAPFALKEYSGKFNVRLPRYLHRELSEMADAEGTSLNQLVLALLSEGTQRRGRGHQAARAEGGQAVRPGKTVEDLEAAHAHVDTRQASTRGFSERRLRVFGTAGRSVPVTPDEGAGLPEIIVGAETPPDIIVHTEGKDL